MGIASLLNLNSDQEFSGFAFANQDHHNLITQNINLLLQPSQALTFYILDPIADFDLQNWLRRHQQSHDDINLALGTEGADLTDVDFKKQSERDAWATLHWSEHQLWFQATGID